MTRALITGGAGFIGSHLAETLLDPAVTSRLSTNCQPARWPTSSIVGASRLRLANESITNEMVLDRLVNECDVIFHMAAAVGVRLIIQQPVRTIETNVMGTETVLKTALRYRARC